MSRSGQIIPFHEKKREPAPLSHHDDDELLLLARGGKSAAFDEIVRRHQTRALRIASKYLGQTALAKDVTQNAFIEVYRALPRYKPVGRFQAYLYRVLLNQCRMSRRSSRLDERTSKRYAGDPRPDPEQPEGQILAQERRREVEHALEQLSTKLRVVLVLRFGGDLSYREIAEVLDLPLGTVKRRIFDALERLRRTMERDR
jgi:RNA polymerase sigma-70 factor (ECF subfamily)